MIKILITGANGQLAQCIQKQAKKIDANQYQFLFVNREQLDITDKELVETFFFTNKIDCVVNCAAYTAVDNAESDVENAFKVNADAVATLAKETKEQGADFIHISTDYVFNGLNHEPFTTEDLTQPISIYGKSKLEGERLAVEQNPNAIIIRTAWVYSEFGKNFMKTMLRLFSDKEEISVVKDQIGTPTNANDLAKAIITIIQSDKKVPGVYHYTNSGQTTWYEFALAIKEFTDGRTKINPIPTSDYPTPAARPAFSVLDTTKIKEIYNVEIPDWRESLQVLLNANNIV